MILQVIPDIMREVVAKVSAKTAAYAQGAFPVFFEVGHYREVERNIVEKGKTKDQKNQRFPVIWLVMDFPETMDPQRYGLGVYSQVKLELILATNTEPNWSVADRYTNTFKPILYPMLDELLKVIGNTPDLGSPPFGRLKYKKTDRPYWGVQNGMGGTANFFSAFVDAIQIENLELNIKRKNC